MKYLPIVLLGLCGAMASATSSAQIYRCTSAESVIYQDSPCPPGYDKTVVVAKSEERAPPPSPTTIEPPPVMNTSLLPATAAINVGMTDSQVLNLRGWGKPQKITRSKVNRAWHEEWTYASAANGQRRLQFANGRLRSIQNVDSEPENIVASTLDPLRP